MYEKFRLAVPRAGSISLQSAALLVLLALPASAAEPTHRLLGCPVPDCIGKWCCDDYCPKREPCVSVPLCFGCDDYCSKRAPNVCVPLRFGCDDYRKKCPPKVCSRPLFQYLRCGSAGQPCGCAACDQPPRDTYASKRDETKTQASHDGEAHQTQAQGLPQSRTYPPVIVQAAKYKQMN